MSAGNDAREAARKTRIEARQNRDKAADMQKLGKDLEKVADEQNSQATILERQARDSDDAESRAERFKI